MFCANVKKGFTLIFVVYKNKRGERNPSRCVVLNACFVCVNCLWINRHGSCVGVFTCYFCKNHFRIRSKLLILFACDVALIQSKIGNFHSITLLKNSVNLHIDQCVIRSES